MVENLLQNATKTRQLGNENCRIDFSLGIKNRLKFFFNHHLFVKSISCFFSLFILLQERLLLSVLPEHVAVKMRQDLGSEASEPFKKIYMSRHENVR